MDILQAIKERRSARTFSNRTVDEAIVKELVELAAWAPSNCNVQGWKFIVVNEEKVKQDMVNRGGARIIKGAPLGILVLYYNQTHNTEYMDYIQSAAAAIQNILLSAHSFGLATCWVCHLPRKKELQKIFGFPSQYSPVAYVLLGHPKQEPKKVERKYRVEDLVSYNYFNFSKGTVAKKEPGLKIRWLARKIYYLMPAKIKECLDSYIDKKFVKKFEN